MYPSDIMEAFFFTISFKFSSLTMFTSLALRDTCLRVQAILRIMQSAEIGTLSICLTSQKVASVSSCKGDFKVVFQTSFFSKLYFKQAFLHAFMDFIFKVHWQLITKVEYLVFLCAFQTLFISKNIVSTQGFGLWIWLFISNFLNDLDLIFAFFQLWIVPILLHILQKAVP